MAGEQQVCVTCERATKYKCLNCKSVCCNRPTCSVAEVDEETVGWVENVSVAYCNSCFLGLSTPANCSTQISQTQRSDVDEDDDEITDILENKAGKSEKKACGRRSLWTTEQIDDMVDIIVNSESYKKKLIFTNNRRFTNTEVYNHVLKQIGERHPAFPFNVTQMRNKFKWCVGVCKKVALTIQTATGIKRFVKEKGFGKWFDALFPLIKSRDSCQPEQAIEPSTSRSSSTTTTPVSLLDDEDENGDGETEEPPHKKGRDLFVPIKKRKRNNESEAVNKVLKVLESMIENDPTKELIEFMKEDAEKSRQNEMELIRILSSQNSNTGYVPIMHQEAQGLQPRYYHAPPRPQHWQQPQVAMVPQTPPSGRHSYQQAGHSSPFEQMKTYTKL